jgi:bacterial/archaeal transporter family-2 protein
MNINLAAALAVGAGVCIALQAGANTRLRAVLQPAGLWASYFSILGTVVLSTIAMLLLRPPTPAWASLQQSSWWNWIGGPLGALIVLAGTMLVQHLGAAVFIALVVAGQLMASLILDHFGLMELPVSEVTWKKGLGASLILVGVIAMKW